MSRRLDVYITKRYETDLNQQLNPADQGKQKFGGGGLSKTPMISVLPNT